MPIEHGAERPPIRFLDLDFSALSFDEVLSNIQTRAKADSFSYIVTPNVDHVVTLSVEQSQSHAARFQAAYARAALRLCDSRILCRIGKCFGIALPVVPGSDLTLALFERVLGHGDRVVIIGGDANMLPRLSARFPAPALFQHIPPMGVLNNAPAMEAAVAFIITHQAHFILLAIGAPQSEILALRCLEQGVAKGVGLCIGASIDFILGDQRRAPIWVQRMGMEWAHRLLSQPRRLWRRYLIEGPKIFLIAARWKMNRRA